MNREEIIKVFDLYKSFKVGDQNIEVLKGINLTIYEGDFIVIYGPSGCGKSTLLHSILGLEKPTQGYIEFSNTNLYAQMNTDKNGNPSEDLLSEFRKRNIGMIYQQPNWVKSLDVIENVELPLSLLGVSKESRELRAYEMVETVGMINWKNYFPMQLSSGQQQKIALARALIGDPKVIIADEPTGNLDFESGQELMNILQNLNQRRKKTIIMVTHDLEYLSYATKTVKMFDGRIVDNIEVEKQVIKKKTVDRPYE